MLVLRSELYPFAALKKSLEKRSLQEEYPTSLPYKSYESNNLEVTKVSYRFLFTLTYSMSNYAATFSRIIADTYPDHEISKYRE